MEYLKDVLLGFYIMAIITVGLLLVSAIISLYYQFPGSRIGFEALLFLGICWAAGYSLRSNN